MPLFYQHNINDSTKLAVWKITETEDFFLEKVAMNHIVMHSHKRLQHLAGRYLLQILEPGFPTESIKIAESGKPFLLNDSFHFSISHCANFAAAIISESKPVGIDVELVTPKIEKVKTRFLREDELAILESDEFSTFNYQMLTLFWSAKETIYKWHGKSRLSFKSNMSLNELFFENNEGYINSQYIKEEKINLKIEYKFFGDLCLSWL